MRGYLQASVRLLPVAVARVPSRALNQLPRRSRSQEHLEVLERMARERRHARRAELGYEPARRPY
ncbi:MAG TPA: hypothetical protein VKT31_08935 [Solirubrobacteraceae bacterium]|nr:hypothetical protein [Solirubrobacteraceae bacterium]